MQRNKNQEKRNKKLPSLLELSKRPPNNICNFPEFYSLLHSTNFCNKLGWGNCIQTQYCKISTKK